MPLLGMFQPNSSWKHNYLVVSTLLKSISQIGSSPQVGMKIKNVWNHHLDNHTPFLGCFFFPVISYPSCWKKRSFKAKELQININATGPGPSILKQVSNT